MEKLVILNYANANIHIYDIDPNTDIDENYIEELGFNTNECSWMFGEGIEITYHKEVLK